MPSLLAATTGGGVIIVSFYNFNSFYQNSPTTDCKMFSHKPDCLGYPAEGP